MNSLVLPTPPVHLGKETMARTGYCANNYQLLLCSRTASALVFMNQTMMEENGSVHCFMVLYYFSRLGRIRERE